MKLATILVPALSMAAVFASPMANACTWTSPFDNNQQFTDVSVFTHSGEVITWRPIALQFWGGFYDNESNQHPMVDDAAAVFNTNTWAAKLQEYGVHFTPYITANNGFWADNPPGTMHQGNLEIGDLCQNMRDTINGAPSALIWSQSTCSCR